MPLHLSCKIITLTPQTWGIFGHIVVCNKAENQGFAGGGLIMCGWLKRSGLSCNHFRRKSKVGAGDMGGGGRVDLVSLHPSIRCPPPAPGQETGCASVGGLIIGLSLWGWAPSVPLLLHSSFYPHHLRLGGVSRMGRGL